VFFGAIQQLMRKNDKDKTMEISLTLPDDIGKQLQHLPNPSEFLSKVVKEALKNLTSPLI
jgi:hypothetical protein